MLASSCRKDSHLVALHNLQQRLLNAGVRDVPDDGCTGFGGGVLVYLVEHDDTILRHLEVVVALAEKSCKAVLDVRAYVSGGGDLRAVLYVARHVQTLYSNEYLEPSHRGMSGLLYGLNVVSGVAHLFTDGFQVSRDMGDEKFQFQWSARCDYRLELPQ